MALARIADSPNVQQVRGIVVHREKSRLDLPDFQLESEIVHGMFLSSSLWSS